ncbi:peptidase inhibitor family I36 protein [Lentzea terrae]|uniref:peptidase inhibitor family I36 protein n=1 Tax=Lentzea terrae TaxID=2200761 RepID=UPI000DD2D012|nr:peptidase inhibitor family I36 protein [Lentzea terrae]
MQMKRFVVAFLAVLAAFVLTAGNASAAEPRTAELTAADVSIMAWECPSGHFCAYTGLNGTGSRCAWSGADPDWLSGNVRCSWAGSTRVQSYKNNGTSGSFTGVEIYRNADYIGKFHCVLQGGQGWNVTAGGVLLRSHRWISSTCN